MSPHEMALRQAEGNVRFAYEMIEALKVASDRRKAFYAVDYKLTPEEHEIQNDLVRLHHEYVKVYNELRGK